MGDSPISSLSDLARLRGAPELSEDASARLRSELREAMTNASWFTVGVMPPLPNKPSRPSGRWKQARDGIPWQLLTAPTKTVLSSSKRTNKVDQCASALNTASARES
jgi:hypothetical protein